MENGKFYEIGTALAETPDIANGIYGKRVDTLIYFLLLGNDNSTVRTSALNVCSMNFGFRLSVFFTEIKTPPPLSLNSRGFDGSRGWEEPLRSKRNILYFLENETSSSYMDGFKPSFI